MRILRTISLALLVLLLPAAAARTQPSDVTAKFRLAQGLEAAGDYAHAAEIYRELLARDPSNYVLFDALQRIDMQLKRYDDAIALIRTRLHTNPSDLNLRGMLGTAYYRAGKEKEAAAQWDSAIAASPRNPAVYRSIAGILIENRMLEKAAEVYRRGREACGNPRLFSLEVAQLRVATMNYAGATTEYLHWLEVNPTQLSFVQNRMSMFTSKEDARAAAIDVVRASLRGKEDVRLEELLGWLYMEGKQFADALEVYRTIDRITHAGGASLYGFAERAYTDHAYADAATAYREAQQDLPAGRAPYAAYGYARSLAALGEAADTLDAPPDLFPPAVARPELSQALDEYRQILAKYPHGDVAAKSYYDMGVILWRDFSDLNGALQTFQHAGQEVQHVPALRYDVALKIGQVLTAEGDTAGAAARFRTVAGAPDATPDQSDEGAFRLAEFDYFGGNVASAIKRLNAITLNLKADYANDALLLQGFLQENQATAPEALARFAQADLLARRHMNSEAAALFQDIATRFPKAPLADDALIRAAGLQVRTGQFTDALATYERLLTQFKDNSNQLDRAQFNIGLVYQYGLKDRTKAVAAYENLLADFPQSLLATQARERIRTLRGDAMEGRI